MFSGVDIDMDMNKLTQKSQEAFYEAQNIAVRHGHQEVDAENLALALLRQENGLIPRLFDKMNVPVESLANAVENELSKKPRVSGAGQETGKIYVSQRLSKILVRAEDEADSLKGRIYLRRASLPRDTLRDKRKPARQDL